MTQSQTPKPKPYRGTHKQVATILNTPTVKELDRQAAIERRSRSKMLAVLIDEALAARGFEPVVNAEPVAGRRPSK